MLNWMIAHNMGIQLIIVTMILVSIVLMKIEDFIKKNKKNSKKLLTKTGK